MTGTLAHGYSFESAQQELSNEYQHDRERERIVLLILFKQLVSYLDEIKKTQTLKKSFLLAQSPKGS